MSYTTIVLKLVLVFALVAHLFFAGTSVAAIGSGSQDQNTKQPPKPKSDPYFRVALLPKLPNKKAPTQPVKPVESFDSKIESQLTLTKNAGETPVNLTLPPPTNKNVPETNTVPSQPAIIPGQNNLPSQFNPNGNSGAQFDAPKTTFAPANFAAKAGPPETQIEPPANPNPLVQKTVDRPQQPIELDSVASDANLLEPKPIPKISLKPNQEWFEPGRTLARVGGEPIFAADLMFEVNQLIERFMAAAPEKMKREQRKAIIPRLLNKYIESKLIYVDIIRSLPDQANLSDINKSLGDHFDREVLPLILKKNKVKSAGEFDTQLRGQGVSLRQFRKRWIEEEFVKYFLKDKVTLDPQVTHQEMVEYYRKNLADFEVDARAKWEQLMVSFSRIADRKKAEYEIKRMGNEVVYGAPLPAVAKRSSHDFRATEGGMQGWVTKGSLVSQKLDEAIFSLPLNRLSEVIETDTGYHIIRILERTQAGRTPFLKAQVDIAKKIKQQKREAILKEHIAKLKRQIPVETFLDKSELELTGEGKQGEK